MSSSYAEETRARNKITSGKLSRKLQGAIGEKGRGGAPSLLYEAWFLGQQKNPAAAAYLEAAIDEGNQAAIMLALRQVAQAQGGIAEVVRKAKLTREATHKTLSKSSKPELRSLTAVLEATGLRLSVKPIEKPLRPDQNPGAR